MCISILHEPGEDKWGYEKAEERWLPVHTVETILISVISMLADPNDQSPANVDAAVSIALCVMCGYVIVCILYIVCVYRVCVCILCVHVCVCVCVYVCVCMFAHAHT